MSLPFNSVLGLRLRKLYVSCCVLCFFLKHCKKRSMLCARVITVSDPNYHQRVPPPLPSPFFSVPVHPLAHTHNPSSDLAMNFSFPFNANCWRISLLLFDVFDHHCLPFKSLCLPYCSLLVDAFSLAFRLFAALTFWLTRWKSSWHTISGQSNHSSNHIVGRLFSFQFAIIELSCVFTLSHLHFDFSIKLPAINLIFVFFRGNHRIQCWFFGVPKDHCNWQHIKHSCKPSRIRILNSLQ